MAFFIGAAFLQNQLKLYQQRVQIELASLLTSEQHPDVTERLLDAMRYATLNSGKRLRPALIYAVAESLNIPLTQVDKAACAIELIHSYSLVHDDLPAMDDDDLRRGQPTCHIQYDEATAILVGDAQQTLAFSILTESAELSAESRLEMIRLLSHAAGINGMIGGQMLDIASEGQNIELVRLEQLHTMKTGALIQAALLMGAAASPLYAEVKQALADLGKTIGLAFQVQDDILDIEGDTDTLGKPQGSDLQADKSTYPKLLGLEGAKRYRNQLIEQAQQQYQQLPFTSPFLVQLIDYIGQRNH